MVSWRTNEKQKIPFEHHHLLILIQNQPSRLFHPYTLDESICHLRGIRCIVVFLFVFFFFFLFCFFSFLFYL